MAVVASRIKLSVTAEAYPNTTDDRPDLGRIAHEVTSDSYNEGNTRKFKMLAGATATVDFGDITTPSLLVIATEPWDSTDVPGILTFQRSAAGEAIPISKMVGTTVALAVLTMPTLTTLTLDNTGATDLRVTVMLGGD